MTGGLGEVAGGAALETIASVVALTLQLAGLVFRAAWQLGIRAGATPLTGDLGKVAGATLETAARVFALALQLARLVFRAVDCSARRSLHDLVKRNLHLGRILQELRGAEVFVTLGVLKLVVPGPATRQLISMHSMFKELERPLFKASQSTSKPYRLADLTMV